MIILDLMSIKDMNGLLGLRECKAITGDGKKYRGVFITGDCGLDDCGYGLVLVNMFITDNNRLELTVSNTNGDIIEGCSLKEHNASSLKDVADMFNENFKTKLPSQDYLNEWLKLKNL